MSARPVADAAVARASRSSSAAPGVVTVRAGSQSAGASTRAASTSWPPKCARAAASVSASGSKTAVAAGSGSLMCHLRKAGQARHARGTCLTWTSPLGYPNSGHHSVSGGRPRELVADPSRERQPARRGDVRRAGRRRPVRAGHARSPAAGAARRARRRGLGVLDRRRGVTGGPGRRALSPRLRPRRLDGGSRRRPAARPTCARPRCPIRSFSSARRCSGAPSGRTASTRRVRGGAIVATAGHSLGPARRAARRRVRRRAASTTRCWRATCASPGPSAAHAALCAHAGRRAAAGERSPGFARHAWPSSSPR